jgi:exodeoxyribonuclease VII large subunit
MTADVRAATPSHAAQMLWPLRSELAQRVDDLETSLQRAHKRCLEAAAARLQALWRAVQWFSPAGALGRKDEAAARAHEGLERAISRLLSGKGAKLEALSGGLRVRAEIMLHAPERALEKCAASLAALDPHAPLDRGCAFVYDGQGRLLRSVHEVKKDDLLRLRLRDGVVDALACGIREDFV